MSVQVDGRSLTCADVVAVAHGGSVSFPEEGRARMAENYGQWLALDGPDILAGKEAWLVGSKNVKTEPQERVRAFVESHCAGVGPELDEEAVRALMLCRANVLAHGKSGCRPEAVEVLLSMLEKGVHPVVPSLGSVGAAGDLAPLAHMARVAFRLGGKARAGGMVQEATEAMAGVAPFFPTSKEALSFINGATLSAALGAIACHRAERLLFAAELALGLTMEVVLASPGCLDAAALEARGQPGALGVAQRLRDLLDGSQLVVPERGPDAFSVRCAPAVLGAGWDALAHVKEVIERELNGACDNPLVVEGRLVEAGNFHGAPVGLALDTLKISLTQVGTLAERRVFRLTHGELSGNLPSFLLESTGLNSGFMLAQYTAASLASENKGLAHPASVDSIPTGQHHEDHVSMAPIAARGCLAILDNLSEIVGIEALAAAQGLEFRREGARFSRDGERVPGEPVSLAPGVSAVLARIRAVSPRWTEDRVLHLDLEKMGALVRAGGLQGKEEAW
jgi:histidine ammonia-lyase